MVLHARSYMQNYVCIKVTVGANLHHLIYNLLIAIVFSLLILLSIDSKKISVEDRLNTEGLVALTEYQQVLLKIDQTKKLL